MSDDIEKRAIDLIVDTYGPTEYVGGQAMPGDGPARVRAIREGRGNEYWEMRLAKKALEAHDATKAEFSQFAKRLDSELASAGFDSTGPMRRQLSRFILPEPVDPLVEAIKALQDGRAGVEPESYAACLRNELTKRGLTITKEASHEPA